MSDTPARDVLTAIVAEQRVGLLNVQLGKKKYRLQILPEEIGLLEWGALPQLKITDVLTYEGVASEEDFLQAQQESKKRRKPIEQVLEQVGLLEAELLPAIEARLVIEAVYGLLTAGEAGVFEENDGNPPSEPEAVIEVSELLEFMTRVEEDFETFAGHAEMTSIIGLTVEPGAIKAQPEIVGYATTLGRLVNGCRDVNTLIKESRLPTHHVLRTLNSFFDAGVARKFSFADLQKQAAVAEEKGKYDEAYDLYQAAHHLRPTELEVLEKLAMIAELIENKPGIADANSLLAQLYSNARNEPQAVKCYERVIRFDPHHHAAHEYLFKHAVRQELQGEMVKIGRELIRIHFERGEYDQAKQVASRCLTVAPGDIRLLDALAKTHVTCGETQAAVAVYEKVMEQYEKKGERQEAMNLLMILRRLAPEREDFHKKIEAAHSAERRKAIIKWVGLSMAPIVLVALVLFLLSRASAARAEAAHDAIVQNYNGGSQSKKIETLQTLLTSMNDYLREYPTDVEVQDLMTELNIKISEAEEKVRLELENASREARRLYEEGAAARIGPPPRFDRARSLLDEAFALVPASDVALRNDISEAVNSLRQAIADADHSITVLTVQRIKDALEEKDLRTVREQMRILEELASRDDFADEQYRDLKQLIERSASSIVGGALAEARDRQAAGFLEDALVLFRRLMENVDDPKVEGECEDQIESIEAGLVEARGWLETGEEAIQSGDNSLAVSVLQKLYKNYGNTSIADKIRLPVEVNSSLDIVDITTSDGKKRKDVPMPYTVRLALDDTMTIELSREGFEAVTVKLSASFESYQRYVPLERDPVWEYEIDGSMAQRPVAHGSAVLLASSKSSLHLVDLEKGTLLWEAPFPLGGITGFGSEPIVCGSTCVVPTTARKVLGVSAETGQKLWELPGGKAFRGAPAVDADGKTVYVGCDDGLVYAIDAASGASVRTGAVGSAVCGKILYHEGHIYFGAEDDHLHALNARTLQEVWKFRTGSDILTRPIISGGLLFFASRDTKVYAVGLDGVERWSHGISGAVVGDMGMARGTVFASTVGVDGVVQGLETGEGQAVSVTPVVGPIPGGVAVSGDRLYFGSEDSYIRCFKITLPLVLKWELKVNGRITTAPSVVSDMLIVGTTGNRVYAFKKE